jgi:hypothetical protein
MKTMSNPEGPADPPIERAERPPLPSPLAFALDSISERFGRVEGDERLEYHDSEHTEHVAAGTEKVITALQGNEREQLLGKIAAAFHDYIQKWREKDERGIIVRERLSGDNERESADAAETWMRSQNEMAEGKFTEEDIAMVREAIEATKPGWDSKYGTAFQPGLTPESSKVTRGLLYSDLGAAGMSPERYAGDGTTVSGDGLDLFVRRRWRSCGQ